MKIPNGQIPGGNRGPVIVTRPHSAAEKTVLALKERGYDVCHIPVQYLTSVAPLQTDFDQAAYIFTSPNGVYFSKDFNLNRQALVFTVGDATAKAAKTAGFTHIICGAGQAQSLLPLIDDRKVSRVIHFSGRHVAFDLVGALNDHGGVEAARAVCYEAKISENLSEMITGALPTDGGVVLFYSARAAQAFEKGVQAAHMGDKLAHMQAVVLSDRIQKALSLTWAGIHCAAQPTEDAMLKVVDTIYGK